MAIKSTIHNLGSRYTSKDLIFNAKLSRIEGAIADADSVIGRNLSYNNDIIRSHSTVRSLVRDGSRGDIVVDNLINYPDLLAPWATRWCLPRIR